MGWRGLRERMCSAGSGFSRMVGSRLMGHGFFLRGAHQRVHHGERVLGRRLHRGRGRSRGEGAKSVVKGCSRGGGSGARSGSGSERAEAGSLWASSVRLEESQMDDSGTKHACEVCRVPGDNAVFSCRIVAVSSLRRRRGP